MYVYVEDMKTKEKQISAVVSITTVELLDSMVKARGLKKGYVIENALRQYLVALRELPPEFIIPPRVVVSNESTAVVLESLKKPKPPAEELRKLMKGEPVSDDGLD